MDTEAVIEVRTSVSKRVGSNASVEETGEEYMQMGKAATAGVGVGVGIDCY